MTQTKNGVESQTVTTKTVVLGLSAVFLTYFLASLSRYLLHCGSRYRERSCHPGPVMNVTYEKMLENLLPPDLDHHIDAATFESIADPRVLMSKDALADLQSAFNRIKDQKPMLLDQTVQAIRDALQSGLKALFLMGAVALLIALLFILTIPEVSMDAEVPDKNPGS